MEGGTDSLRPVRFGAFELDLRARELRRGVTRIRLQEQPFEILRLMIQRAGDVVTREELRQHLWPEGTFVDFEHSLNAAVKRLRAALGDDAENPRFVETLPRRGYRFIAKLDGVGPGEAAAAPRVRLAVLPFSNLSGDTSQEYFSDGLTDEMISQVGRHCRGRVGVLARSSSMVFKDSTRRAREIGEALRADYLLEGTVRREGDRVRITARLVESAGETHLWSDTYDRHLTDVLAVQTEVASRIARSLAMELGSDGAPARPTPDTHAYQCYLKGRFYWNKPGLDGLAQAIAHYRRALEAAPAFAGAHAALARAHVASAEYYAAVPGEALADARATALRALDIDPSLAEAHLALADATRMLEWDWPGAEAAYAEAIALNPSYESAHRGYGMMLASLGDSAGAIRETERACELDPLCLTVGTCAAWARYAAGEFDAAIVRCRHILDMDPAFLPARRLLGAACLMAGREADALAELHAAAAAAPTDPVILAWLAHATAATGAHDEARGWLGRARAREGAQYVPPYSIALACAGLGETDAAFAALDRACVDRDPMLGYAAVEPRLEPLRADPRFDVLLARIGLRTR